MRTLIAILMVASAIGCHGPLTKPMVDPLNEEDQKTIDDSWTNLLTPSDRHDRLLLLDVILSKQLFQVGVDRLQMTSEKTVGGDLLIMEVRFDRQQPEFDQFTITLVGHDQRELRREKFTRFEIDERLMYLYDSSCDYENPEEMTPSEIAECEAIRAERNARFHEMAAATQPAE